MPSIHILGKEVGIEFMIGQGAQIALDEDRLLAGAREMATLINRTEWPADHADAFRQMAKIVFFEGQVMVNGYLMDRPCCDTDDAVFYWEGNEFMKNTDADVRANTFFHDCWHVVQFKRANNRYAANRSEELAREVDAINEQIEVARRLGCSANEIDHLEDYRQNQGRIAARLDEGVERLAAHRAGGMAASA